MTEKSAINIISNMETKIYFISTGWLVACFFSANRLTYCDLYEISIEELSIDFDCESIQINQCIHKKTIPVSYFKITVCKLKQQRFTLILYLASIIILKVKRQAYISSLAEKLLNHTIR